MKLYGTPLSPFVTRVTLAAQAMGIELPHEPMPPGGMKSAEHLALTPTGKIPCFEDGGLKMGESETIVEYLQDKYPDQAIRPTDPIDKAKTRLIGRFTDLHLAPHLGPMFNQMNADSPDAEIIDRESEAMKTGLDYVEATLGDGPYAIGDKLGPADCALAPVMFYVALVFTVLDLGDPTENRPKLKAWWSQMQDDPMVSAALDHQREALEEMRARRAAEAAASA